MKNVPAEVIWLPSQSPRRVCQEIKDLLGVELIDVDDPLQSSDGEECYVTIFGKLRLQNLSQNTFELLINRWCKQAVDKHEKWLSLDKEMMFHDDDELINKWICVDSLSFGTIIGLNKFAEHYNTVEQNSNKIFKSKVAQIKMYLEHDTNLFSVYFHVTDKNRKNDKERSAATHRPYRFQFHYSSIYRVLINRTPDLKSIDLFLYVCHPPLIYAVELPIDPDNASYENYIKETPETTYTRVNTFADCSDSDIGLSTVLKLQLSPKNSWEAISNFILNSRTSFYFSPILKLKVGYNRPMISVDQFNCIYALESLLSRSWDVITQINERKEVSHINEKLNKFAKENPKALEATLFNIFALFEQKKIVNFSNALDVLYHKRNIVKKESSNDKKELSVPENMTAVRRAILTPTRIILLPPQPYFKCRFFRDFQPEYTIRLSIKDDNISNLSFTLFGRPKKDSCDFSNIGHLENINFSNNNLNGTIQTQSEDNTAENSSFHNITLEKINKQLKEGFGVGNRQYKLLGSSSSHFREHGILFYAKDTKKRNAEYARKAMGEFDKIKNVTVPKYMARLGQVFSQSLDHIKVPRNRTKVDDDIEVLYNEDDKYQFSDGIGKIAPSIAQKVFKKLKIKYNPSAMQIRYAGAKGMLTQWPELEDQIVFRYSMWKFESNSDDLEILKLSKPRLVHLNRPFITILSQLGIPDNVFLQYQNNIFEELFNSLIYEIKAICFLHVHSLLRIDYENIRKVGIKVLQEPFFRSMIQALFERTIELLTSKARIPIPAEKGRTMFGVLDETGTLNYGEVFVQYTENVDAEEEDAKKKIHTGTVLVTKYPCMHPGDVRKFEAVDVEALHHIKDCIVFPAKGPRPHPNEMAGSDLDGDEYSVIWAKELIFECENHDAMLFPEDTINPLKRRVEVKDMVDFFCTYISGERVGQIATAHLVWADRDENGIFCDRCKKLAHKYSVALDFAKRGKPERLDKEEHPDEYPDFLDKGLQKNTYLSKSVLGQLYRCSKTVQLGCEGLVCTPRYFADEDLNYPGREIYNESAKDALCKFNNEVDSILQQYGIQSEGELFSGAISKTSKYISVKQDFNDLSIIVERIKKLFEEMQNEFCEEFQIGEMRRYPLTLLLLGEHKERVLQKASAWYMTTYEQPVNEKRYFGLPWTIHEVICGLKEKMRKLRELPSSVEQFEERMSNMILENFPNVTCSNHNHMDVALTTLNIMHEWLSNQRLQTWNEEEQLEYDSLVGETLGDIYNEITDDLEKEDNTEVVTVYTTVLKYLHKLSCMIFRRRTISRSRNNSYLLHDDIMGLLAFKTLLNIFYSREFNSSSVIEADMKLIKQVFRVPLPNDDFFKCITHEREALKILLQVWTKVDEIEFRLKPDRHNKWFVLFKVKGNKYAIHQFQTTILQNNFLSAVKNLI